MKGTFVPLVVLVALVAACVCAGTARADGSIAVDIVVSPNVININSQSTVVTVHTDIPYYLVDGATVKLNDVEIAWWKMDNRGYFVAKFLAGEVKDIVEPGTTATLTLSGVTKTGREFSGSDDVRVIAVKGAYGR